MIKLYFADFKKQKNFKMETKANFKKLVYEMVDNDLLTNLMNKKFLYLKMIEPEIYLHQLKQLIR